jgi:hypothetical protein
LVNSASVHRQIRDLVGIDHLANRTGLRGYERTHAGYLDGLGDGAHLEYDIYARRLVYEEFDILG